jgi:hypothetical protein
VPVAPVTKIIEDLTTEDAEIPARRSRNQKRRKRTTNGR